MPRTLRKMYLGLISLCWLLLTAHGGPARADEVILSVDEAQSSMTLTLSDPMFGSWTAQIPGSDITSVSGHFLVQFDPFQAGGPAGLQYLGGHGYLAFGSAAGGAPLGPWGAPANFGLKTPGNEFELSFQNTIWDWFSDELPLVAGAFDSNNLGFQVLQGSYSGQSPAVVPPAPPTEDFTGFSDYLNGGGSTTLVETTPGSGEWVLNSQVSYTVGLANDITATFSGTIVSRAQYGAANVRMVDPAVAPRADVLGGLTQPGGVSALFAPEDTAGTLSAQQIPFTGLSQAAIEAGTENPIFALSTAELAVDPQIWEVDYSGALAGPVSLVFAYDPAKLPPGTDESLLGIWHFNQLLDKWQFGGTVDTAAHTVTFTTDNFSPFVLGIAVPEPSTWALAVVALALTALGRRRSRM